MLSAHGIALRYFFPSLLLNSFYHFGQQLFSQDMSLKKNLFFKDFFFLTFSVHVSKKVCYGNGSKDNPYFLVPSLLLASLKNPIHSETLLGRKLIAQKGDFDSPECHSAVWWWPRRSL